MCLRTAWSSSQTNDNMLKNTVILCASNGQNLNKVPLIGKVIIEQTPQVSLSTKRQRQKTHKDTFSQENETSG